MLKLIAKEITWDAPKDCPIELPTEVEFENPTVAQLCDYFTKEGVIAETLSNRYDWGVNSLKLVLEDTRLEDAIVKPIYVLEQELNDRFDDAIQQIEDAVADGDPLTLEEVLEFGFNNVTLNGKRGYQKDDFTIDELLTRVTWDDWQRDDDGYRYVILKEIA